MHDGATTCPFSCSPRWFRSFENAGLAKSVSRARDGASGDYQLILDIRTFQISKAAEPATAEIDFIAKLIDKDGKIVNASTFQGNAPVEGDGAQAYVNAIDKVFAKLAGELIGWVTTAIAALPPPALPLRLSLRAMRARRRSRARGYAAFFSSSADHLPSVASPFISARWAKAACAAALFSDFPTTPSAAPPGARP